MATVAAPYGFRPVQHLQGGTIRARAYKGAIASGYGSSLYTGTPVFIDASGNLNICTATTPVTGIFAGVQYKPAGDKLQVFPMWTASVTASGDITAYVWNDPRIIFQVQSAGSISQTGASDQLDVTSATSGIASSGQSTAALATSFATVGGFNQFILVDRAQNLNNAWGDTATDLLVVINDGQFNATRTLQV